MTLNSASQGGAISINSGSRMLIDNSLFESNSATLAGALLVDGYGSSVNSTDTTFTQNSASTGAVLYMINAEFP